MEELQAIIGAIAGVSLSSVLGIIATTIGSKINQKLQVQRIIKLIDEAEGKISDPELITLVKDYIGRQDRIEKKIDLVIEGMYKVKDTGNNDKII